MKIYVVLPGFDYEGYGEPLLVTADKDKADALAQESRRYDYINVIERELEEEY